jgi:hypothetical protein
MPEPREVQYLVLPDITNPYLLARVRWPDVAQAVTAACPDWLEDPGLFDLPNDPSSATVMFDQAAAIAAAWGVSLLSEERFHSSGPSLIRRMPANWSDLAPAEIRAWSLDFVDMSRRVEASPDTSRTRVRYAFSTSRQRRWRSLLGALTGSPRRPKLEAQARIAELVGSDAGSHIDNGDELAPPPVGEGDVSPNGVNGARNRTRHCHPEVDMELPVTTKNMNGAQSSESNSSSRHRLPSGIPESPPDA